MHPPILAQYALHKVRSDAHLRILNSAVQEERAYNLFPQFSLASMSREKTLTVYIHLRKGGDALDGSAARWLGVTITSL